MHARTPSERGFTLVEILVVMTIILVISGLAMFGIRGARTSGGKLETSAAARRYGDAIDRYQLEHGRQLPVIAAGSTSWPSAKVNQGPIYSVKIGAGAPVNRFYLKGGRAPDVMSKGPRAGARIIAATPACPSIPGKGGAIVYRSGPAGAASCGPVLSSPLEYSLRVFWNGVFVCDVGDVTTSRC
jgi:prepilin-type N-terminal cleavage/methylation domain-containing protein